MQTWIRLVAVMLVVTLAGGAQACIALCTAPADKAQPAAAAAPDKSSCHRCADKSADAKPSPVEPTAPCKHCETVNQDRVATERDGSVLKLACDWTLLPLPTYLAPNGPVADLIFEVTRPHVHSPPGERLHAFCLLLI